MLDCGLRIAPKYIRNAHSDIRNLVPEGQVPPARPDVIELGQGFDADGEVTHMKEDRRRATADRKGSPISFDPRIYTQRVSRISV